MIRRLALCLGLLAATAMAGEKKHPIDRKIEAASEKALSTADMTQVQAEALKLWDAELNRIYGELKKRLKPQAFAALQVAQRDWVKYRDVQVKFIGAFYTQFEGTMYIPMHASAVKEVTRVRALELESLLEMHREHGE